MTGRYWRARNRRKKSMTPWDKKCKTSSFDQSKKNNNTQTKPKTRAERRHKGPSGWNNTSNAARWKRNSSDVADFLAMRWTSIPEKQPEAVWGSRLSALVPRQIVSVGRFVRVSAPWGSHVAGHLLRQDKTQSPGIISAGSWNCAPVALVHTHTYRDCSKARSKN